MGHSMIERAVTVNVEAAHRDADGRMHGHSYLVECWSVVDWDLPVFERRARDIASLVDHTVLEASVGDSTMEALAHWFLGQTALHLTRVVVRRPTLGYLVEARP
jgi:6-pyruvoyl-tetrahydropterin synthase